MTAEEIAKLARSKNILARKAFQRCGFYLGVGLANLINLLNPEKIILGGSVMKSADLFWKPMIQSVHQHAWPTLYRACRIVKTGLGDQVGNLGALALVFSAKGIGISHAGRR
jgi:glucokinase